MYHYGEKLKRIPCRSYMSVLIGGVAVVFLLILLTTYAFNNASLSNDLVNKYTQIAQIANYVKQEQINLEHDKQEFAAEVVRIAQLYLFVYIYINIFICIYTEK